MVYSWVSETTKYIIFMKNYFMMLEILEFPINGCLVGESTILKSKYSIFKRATIYKWSRWQYYENNTFRIRSCYSFTTVYVPKDWNPGHFKNNCQLFCTTVKHDITSRDERLFQAYELTVLRKTHGRSKWAGYRYHMPTSFMIWTDHLAQLRAHSPSPCV